MITANNVIIGNGESVALTFGVKNITSPVTVSFASNGGNLQSPLSYTFGDTESSYTITLQTNSANSYHITPSVGATNMAPVIVSTAATTMFQLPLGTYNIKASNMINVSDCSYVNFGPYTSALFVNSNSGQYLCLSINGYSECQQSGSARLESLLLPSDSDPTGMFGGYFNASWKNGTFIMNTVFGIAQQCAGMMQTINWSYLSSSTTAPYPIPPSPTPSSIAFKW